MTLIYGVHIERPRLGSVSTAWNNFVASTSSTSPPTRRNLAGDVDVMCYSLRK